jgi:hypothetical protein
MNTTKQSANHFYDLPDDIRAIIYKRKYDDLYKDVVKEVVELKEPLTTYHHLLLNDKLTHLLNGKPDRTREMLIKGNIRPDTNTIKIPSQILKEILESNGDYKALVKAFEGDVEIEDDEDIGDHYAYSYYIQNEYLVATFQKPFKNIADAYLYYQMIHHDFRLYFISNTIDDLNGDLDVKVGELSKYRTEYNKERVYELIEELNTIKNNIDIAELIQADYKEPQHITSYTYDDDDDAIIFC